LLQITNDWLVSLNSHLCTDVIYIDFAKAFDSIVISKLLHKLEYYGISGLLLKWISLYLHDRTQCVVKLKVVFLRFCPVVSGVPQGSVLDPILFLIYINDVYSACKGSSILQLFADDAKLDSRVSVEDHTNFLQLSLDSLSAWADQWQLAININKCSVLHIAPKAHHSSSNYLINGTQIPVHSSCVDVEVIINDDLSFRDHINSIVSIFQGSATHYSVLLRGFVSRRLDIMRTASATQLFKQV
jgi:ribonuclease P/MRP protein subunit RPP40